MLEQVPEAEKDWHPGSDGQVLDLVHPSLFCLVREASGAPERAWENPADRYAKYEFSEKFQWLPTDADVSDDGDVTFRSYVNNVHPEVHHELAAVLPDLFARLRPLFENVLTDLRHLRLEGADAFRGEVQPGRVHREGVLHLLHGVGVEGDEGQHVGLRQGYGHLQVPRHLHGRAGTDALERGRLVGFEHPAPEGHGRLRALAVSDIGAPEQLEVERSQVRGLCAGR
ncbi:hypothetical protein STANM309S_05188 [Streptomyces tanashiensis]